MALAERNHKPVADASLLAALKLHSYDVDNTADGRIIRRDGGKGGLNLYGCALWTVWQSAREKSQIRVFCKWQHPLNPP